MILDKIKILGLQTDIDIYKAVCNLRSQRSGMIQTEKQYQFSHQAICEFIERYEKTLNSKKTSSLENSMGENSKGFVTSTPRTSSLSSVYSNSNSLIDKKTF